MAIELIPINATSGKRSIFGEADTILEAFKPGDEPPQNTRFVGQSTGKKPTQVSSGGGVVLVAPNKKTKAPENGLTPDSGGLY